jgi:hypothetical protein
LPSIFRELNAFLNAQRNRLFDARKVRKQFNQEIWSMHFLKKRFVNALSFSALSLSILLVSGCGNGGDDDGSAGSDRAGVVIGAITAGNPLIVNDVRWELTNVPTVIEDGDDDGRGLLSGFIARVQGGLSAGNSVGRGTSIATGAELRGAVTAIDAARFAFTVLGVEAVISPNTAFENLPMGFAGIVAGDFLQVSGYPTQDNKVIATRIIKRDTNTVFKVTGTVQYPACTTSSCDASQFQIGTVTVDTKSAVLSGGLTGRIPPGTLVKITASGVPTATTLVAATVKPYAGDLPQPDSVVLINGVSTGYSSGKFSVNGIPVSTSSSTTIVGTMTIDMLAATGSLLRVEGRYRNGAIEASLVRRL